MPSPRLQSDVSAGKTAEKGGPAQQPTDRPIAQPAPSVNPNISQQFEGGDGANFVAQQASIARPSANTRKIQAHRGGANFEAQASMRGHSDVSAQGHASRGNHPVRSKGKTSPAQNPDKPSVTA